MPECRHPARGSDFYRGMGRKAARGDGTDGEGKKWIVEEGEKIPGHLSADAPRADLLFGVFLLPPVPRDLEEFFQD